ncbi:helix-turn-helix domain-containing protein [Micromonospora sp. NPDC005324]|uniref:helix-turn-helix domain-containing protein n=1 Tax=Micromonospora sp. NPDC005324 TaxID=3157033 RepID=UPI0033AEBBF0
MQGVPLVADTRWPELAPDDLVIVPGWRPAAHGPQGPVSPGDLLRLAEHHAAGGTVVYARRNGHEPQASALMRHRSHLSDSVHRVQNLIDSRYAEPLPLAELAAAGGVAERTLTRLFRASTGLTPLGYQQLLRVERAEHLIGRGTTVEAAARAVGFTGARMLRRLRARPTRSDQVLSGSSRPGSGTPPATSRAA